MIENKQLRETLHKNLQTLDDKADWEGGLAEMVLGYGGWDYFPESCQQYISSMHDAYVSLRNELKRLSAECGFKASLW